MKVQEVILRAMAKKLTWWQAAEILGISDRQMPRWHRRMEKEGFLPGMLLHIDGSNHRWFGNERWYDLIVIMDDATSEIYYARLVNEESTPTAMAGLQEVVAARGIFCALYGDSGSHFRLTAQAGAKVDRARPTQVGRALRELQIEMIAAYSPEARGRSESGFATRQGRLPHELRLAGISHVGEANQFLRERYIAEYNHRFTCPAAEAASAFVPLAGQDLHAIFSNHHERVVKRDNTVTVGKLTLQIEPARWRGTLASCRVPVRDSTSTSHGHFQRVRQK